MQFVKICLHFLLLIKKSKIKLHISGKLFVCAIFKKKLIDLILKNKLYQLKLIT